jgi:hypothetical protein
MHYLSYHTAHVVTLTTCRPLHPVAIMNLPKPTPAAALRATLALLSLALASCSMPAHEAWRIIKKDGLLSYLNAELQHKGSHSSTSRKTSSYLSNPWQPKTRPQSSTPAATSVAEPKYNAPLTKEEPPAAKPPVINNESAGIPKQTTPKKTSSAPASKTTGEPKKSPPAPTQRKIQPTVSAKKESAETATKAPVPSLQLPYGELIPNRPGMVNSPFAAKHQIVDVAGLSPGQEVKCPYTGKLFRVPGPEQASEPKLKELPTPPPATAKQPEKKSAPPAATTSGN